MNLTITEHKNHQYHECALACQYSVRQTSLEINSVIVPDMVDLMFLPSFKTKMASTHQTGVYHYGTQWFTSI